MTALTKIEPDVNLVVVDFDTGKSLTPAVQAWREENNVPYSMSCARQVWYGTPELFEHFPDAPELTWRGGDEAYAFLLSFAAGFEDQEYSTHNRYQFFKAWQEVQRAMPDVAAQYEQFIRDIELDSKLVHNAIITHYRQPLFDLSARDLSGQQKGDKVLFVGSLSRHGNLSDNTRRIIMATETKQKKCGTSDFITVTHPDPAVLQAIQERIEFIKRNPSQNCAIRSNIRFIPFGDISMAIEESDRVYVDMPQGSAPDAEQAIIAAWKGRVRTDNTLTHLKGNPQTRGLSVPMWADAGLQDYYSPEDIRSEVQRRNQLKKLIWERSSAAFDFCAEMRALGIKPDKTMLRRQAPELLAGLS